MASHWAYISLELAHITESEARRTAAKRIVQEINHSLRNQMVPHPDVVGGYFWDQKWNAMNLPGQDVAHGNAVIAYIVEAAELGEGWSKDDIRALALTFRESIWRVDGDHVEYAAFVDGSGEGTGWFSDGFIKLGRFDQEVQKRLEGHKTGRTTQFYGTAALNAKRLQLASR